MGHPGSFTSTCCSCTPAGDAAVLAHAAGDNRPPLAGAEEPFATKPLHAAVLHLVPIPLHLLPLLQPLVQVGLPNRVQVEVHVLPPHGRMLLSVDMAIALKRPMPVGGLETGTSTNS